MYLNKINLFVIIQLLIPIVPISSVSAQALYKVVPPSVESLAGYQKKEGELAFDSSSRSLKMFKDSSLVSLVKSVHEELPRITKTSASSIEIGRGKIFIDGHYYKNSNSILCSLTTQGVGGYDSELPANHPINYLFLIPDNANVGRFNCIISHLSDSLLSWQGSYKRINSFYTGKDFTSEKGITSYRTYYSVNIPNNTPLDCHEIPLSDLPSSLFSFGFFINCPSYPMSGHEIFSDSSCDPISKLGECRWGLSIYDYSVLVGGKVYAKDFNTASSIEIRNTSERIK